MDANTKRRNFVTSDNKQFGRHVDSSPSRRSSQYSDASKELVELFSRRSSQDSRRTSSTVIGDTRFARDSNRNAISKNEWARFARDHPYEGRRDPIVDQRFYDYALPSKRSSESRLGCESRLSSQNVSEYFPADYRNTYEYIYNKENRLWMRELPPTPTLEVPMTKYAKRNRKFSSNKRFGMSPVYEGNETCERCRRRRSFTRQTKSHDAIWANHDSPHNYVRSYLLPSNLDLSLASTPKPCYYPNPVMTETLFVM
ncbi:unnamed protein product [Cylicostephanus goldi]|uniref:Uncharacterized protein n=1 Tax=Cylicostephanus goldi TaxID=71465 RepID=A0A3P6T411_CYLGO|nr:unnamed protein product [Cylicostephanus goldi]